MAGERGSDNVVPLARARNRAELATAMFNLVTKLEHKADLCVRAAGAQPTDPDVALAAKNWTASMLSAVQAYQTFTRPGDRSRG